MNVKYRNYEPDQGLEDIQAKLYSMNNNRVVTGDEIRERFEREEIDPKSVIYAFTDDDKPLAYVQARDYPQIGQVHLGFPWTTPDCPEEVNEKLFTDLFNYMRNRKSDLSLLMNTRNNPKYVKLAEDHGFSIDRNVINFEFDLDSLKKFDKSAYNYSIREAKEEDWEAIIICRNKAFSQPEDERNERYIEFVKNQIKDGHFLLLYDGDELIGATKPQKPDDGDESKNLRLGGLYTLLEKEEGLVFLMEHALNEAKRMNWNVDHIEIGFTDENPREMKIMQSAARKYEKTNTRYIYNPKK